MTINLVPNHRAIFAPPLEPPLKLARSSPGHYQPDLFGETDGVQDLPPLVPFPTWRRTFHKGVVLEPSTPTPARVFAVRAGHVADVTGFAPGDTNPPQITIRHVDHGAEGFVSRYAGDLDWALPAGIPHTVPAGGVGPLVEEGEHIADVRRVSSGRPPRFRFELQVIVNDQAVAPADVAQRNTEPVDPLPFLYRCERTYCETGADPLGAGDSTGTTRLRDVGFVREDGLSLFRVRIVRSPGYPREFFIPLFDNMNPGDAHAIELLEIAYFERHRVDLTHRVSELLYGKRVITAIMVDDTVPFRRLVPTVFNARGGSD